MVEFVGAAKASASSGRLARFTFTEMIRLTDQGLELQLVTPDISFRALKRGKFMPNTLKQLITDTQETFRNQPAKAKATFTSESQLIEGFRSEVELREHTLTVDEPETLGGSDKGPNPVELILASLGTCQEITYRAYATALDIPLDSVSVKIDGDIDLRGFFAVDDNVRPGYEAIRGTVTLTSSASDEQLETLQQVVNSHCPVLDILANPVPVELNLKVVEEPILATA